jgi:hypothetical protein
MISGKKNIFWLIFHLILGAVSTFTPIILIIWFYLVLLTSFRKSINLLRFGKNLFFIVLFSYLVSFEMVVRMCHAFPFIPSELSKYLLILFSIVGISFVIHKSYYNWLILSFLISISLFIDYSGERVFFDIINNYLGVLAISLNVFLLVNVKLNFLNINKILSTILYAILPSSVYTLIKTPDFEDISFALSANFETAGGASTNQVSTIFGLGFFLVFYFWYKKITFSGYRYLDMLLGIVFFAQGLLTFSRGGIIVAILAIVFFIILDSGKLKIKTIYLGIVVFILLIFTFNYIDNITGGKLLLRYQGETEGTYNYGAEKDLKKMTSGRSMIFEEDLKLWSQFPILGCGVGVSRYIRGGTEDRKVSSHVELSRLLAEHGIFGLIYFISLLNLGIKLWKNSRIDSTKSIYFVLFLIGFLTTFHSAMRTFVTPLLIGLSVIGIQSVKKKNANIIHRSN